MQIIFDPNKDARNQKKHKISLAEASKFDWLNALEWWDDREDHGEDRYIALGFLEDDLYCVVFVDHEVEGGDVRRVFSLRKATNPERKKYAE